MPSPARKPRPSKPSRAAKVAPRRYHHGDLGNALLEAASAAIAEHGLAQLRMRDVTRRVGVSHGAPANHFKDRDALLVALAIQGFERLIERQRQALTEQHETPVDGIAPALRGDAPAAALIAIGVVYVQFAADHPAHFEVMFQRRLLHDPELAQVAARCFEQLVAAVGAVGGKPVGGIAPALRGGAPGKSGARREHELVALGAWALVHGLATLHTQGLLPAERGDVAKIASRVLAAMTELPFAARSTGEPNGGVDR
jgi:AcrR family transcriptional regulator